MIDFNLDTGAIITLLVGVVLPVLVGLVTKTVTAPGVKATILAALALLAGLLSQLGAAIASGVTYDLGAGLVTGLGTFIVAVALHYGLWKPTGVSERAQELGSGRHLGSEREHGGSGLGDAMNGTPESRRNVADDPIA